MTALSYDAVVDFDRDRFYTNPFTYTTQTNHCALMQAADNLYLYTGNKGSQREFRILWIGNPSVVGADFTDIGGQIPFPVCRFMAPSGALVDTGGGRMYPDPDYDADGGTGGLQALEYADDDLAVYYHYRENHIDVDWNNSSDHAVYWWRGNSWLWGVETDGSVASQSAWYHDSGSYTVDTQDTGGSTGTRGEALTLSASYPIAETGSRVVIFESGWTRHSLGAYFQLHGSGINNREVGILSQRTWGSHYAGGCRIKNFGVGWIFASNNVREIRDCYISGNDINIYSGDPENGASVPYYASCFAGNCTPQVKSARGMTFIGGPIEGGEYGSIAHFGATTRTAFIGVHTESVPPEDMDGHLILFAGGYCKNDTVKYICADDSECNNGCSFPTNVSGPLDVIFLSGTVGSDRGAGYSASGATRDCSTGSCVRDGTGGLPNIDPDGLRIGGGNLGYGRNRIRIDAYNGGSDRDGVVVDFTAVPGPAQRNVTVEYDGSILYSGVTPGGQARSVDVAAAGQVIDGEVISSLAETLTGLLGPKTRPGGFTKLYFDSGGTGSLCSLLFPCDLTTTNLDAYCTRDGIECVMDPDRSGETLTGTDVSGSSVAYGDLTDDDPNAIAAVLRSMDPNVPVTFDCGGGVDDPPSSNFIISNTVADRGWVAFESFNVHDCAEDMFSGNNYGKYMLLNVKMTDSSGSQKQSFTTHDDSHVIAVRTLNTSSDGTNASSVVGPTGSSKALIMASEIHALDGISNDDALVTFTDAEVVVIDSLITSGSSNPTQIVEVNPGNANDNARLTLARTRLVSTVAGTGECVRLVANGSGPEAVNLAMYQVTCADVSHGILAIGADGATSNTINVVGRGNLFDEIDDQVFETFDDHWCDEGLDVDFEAYYDSDDTTQTFDTDGATATTLANVANKSFCTNFFGGDSKDIGGVGVDEDSFSGFPTGICDGLTPADCWDAFDGSYTIQMPFTVPAPVFGTQRPFRGLFYKGGHFGQ